MVRVGRKTSRRATTNADNRGIIAATQIATPRRRAESSAMAIIAALNPTTIAAICGAENAPENIDALSLIRVARRWRSAISSRSDATGIAHTATETISITAMTGVSSSVVIAPPIAYW